MSTPTDLPPLMNHVFVDYENVHTVEATIIGTRTVTMTLLLGPKQTKLDTDLVEQMLSHAASVELIRLATSGKNALDFALAYYLGRKVQGDPTACFHIVSKDKGFDPLVEHLRSRNIHVHRHDNFSTLTFSNSLKESYPAVSVAKSKADDAGAALNQVLERLRKNLNNRPKKKATLLSHLKSNLGKDASEAQVARLFERLRLGGHVSIGEKDVVSYNV